MYAMYPVVIISGIFLEGFGPSLLRVFLCIWYHDLKGAESPLIRNILNVAGVTYFLADPLEIIVNSVKLFTLDQIL